MRKLLYLIFLIFTLVFTSCHKTGADSETVIGSADTTTLRLYLDSATVLFDKSDYKQSLEMAKLALEVGKELHDTLSVSDVLSYVVSDYQQLGLLDSAIVTARELLELDKQIGDIEILSNDYNNLAYIYMGCKQFESAREFIEKAIEIESRVDGSPRLATRYGMASEILLNLSNDSTHADSLSLRRQSLEYIDKAYELELSRGDTLRMGRRLSQKADVLVSMHRLSDAEQFYLESIAFFEPLGERHSLGITYRQLGVLYLSQRKYSQAVSYLESSAEITREENELASLMKVYQKLYEAYRNIDEKKSHEYLKLYTQTKDSVYTLESARSLSEFHARYETDKEKEKADEKHSQFVRTLVISTVVLILSFALLVWLYILLRRRSYNNAILHEQVIMLKKQMEEQQRQFLAQINSVEQQVPSSSNAEEQQFMEKLNDAIFRLMGSKEVTADNVASELCMSTQQLRRRIKIMKDSTPIAYINSVRLGYACQLLSDRHDLTIEQVGLLCGFNEATHFARFFKKETGQTPSQFKGK